VVFVIATILAVLVLLASCAGALWQARDAERTGEMKMYQRFRGTSTLLRADDPARFDLHIKRLRAVPWVIACILSTLFLVLELTL